MPQSSSLRRSRTLYATLLLAVVLLGLASRQYRVALPWVIGTYAGDTLWAAMIFLLAAVLWPRVPLPTLAWGALLFSYGIELTQLYHSSWIDAVRGTRVGALVLGHGFLWSDLLCNTVGVVLVAGVELGLRIRPRPRHSSRSRARA